LNNPLKPNVVVLLASSLLLTSTVGYANPPVNTTNNGQTIQRGEYFNTVGNKTTFTNCGTQSQSIHKYIVGDLAEITLMIEASTFAFPGCEKTHS
jgi:hypothetical protein